MIGSIVTRAMTLALGYLYPAYECYKCVENNRPELENNRPELEKHRLESLRFWCEYWMIIAIVTVLERVGGDALISWLPLYGEAKLAFIVYLWYPQTKGTTYVYATFVRPFVAKYEQDIDGNLGELRARTGEVAVIYWQRSSTFFRTRFVELLQFLASQSPGAPQSGSGPPPPPPGSQSFYPPRNPLARASSGGSSFQPSAPPPPPGYPGTAPAGAYPPPPGIVPRSAGGANQRPSAQPPATYPPPRSRSTDEDEEFELVDSSTEPNAPPYMVDEPSGPNGYLTRSRQRALRGNSGGPPPSSNPYFAGSGSQ